MEKDERQCIAAGLWNKTKIWLALKEYWKQWKNIGRGTAKSMSRVSPLDRKVSKNEQNA